MSDEADKLEQRIDAITSHCADALAKLSDGPYIREAIVKQAVTGLIWELFDKMPNERDALMSALEGWDITLPEAIQKEAQETRKAI